MSSSVVKCLFAGVVLLATQIPSRAATLQIEPVLIDVAAPGAASTVSLRNESGAPIDVQIRVFRWSQADGKENLEPTEDVVASPPAVTLAPNASYVARVVRVTKRPISGEESYRVLIDQLPARRQKRTNSVNPPRSGTGMERRGERQQGQGNRPQRGRPAPAHRLAQYPQWQGKDRLLQQGSGRVRVGKVDRRLDGAGRRLCG